MNLDGENYVDHPRIRGEHALRKMRAMAGNGSSPHTRGAPIRGVEALLPLEDHPRIRGEHMCRAMGITEKNGSSPHTRGARRRRLAGGGWRGIIPAYAGSTIVGPDRHAVTADHPRIRGEHIQRPRVEFAGDGSSPHTRGARVGLRGPADRLRIIPAYAGSTSSDDGAEGDSGDHPRIRGEHGLAFPLQPSYSGSSPHTRGAPSNSWVSPPIVMDHPRIRGEH